jgi:addiction module RelE/StbE family toxin
MIPYYTLRFKKNYKKLPAKIQEKADERILLFLTDPQLPELYNHKLDAPYESCRSISITGDIRAIFKLENDVVIFIKIGTHDELYG